jgi:hypothetical protein
MCDSFVIPELQLSSHIFKMYVYQRASMNCQQALLLAYQSHDNHKKVQSLSKSSSCKWEEKVTPLGQNFALEPYDVICTRGETSLEPYRKFILLVTCRETSGRILKMLQHESGTISLFVMLILWRPFEHKKGERLLKGRNPPAS